jgi:hypothetical protein
MGGSVVQVIATVVYVATLAATFAASFYFARRVMTPVVPMQWGFDGNPTWYAPKLVGIWWTSCLTLLGLFFFVVALIEPRKAQEAAYGLIIFSAVMAAIDVGYLMAVARWASKQPQHRP